MATGNSDPHPDYVADGDDSDAGLIPVNQESRVLSAQEAFSRAGDCLHNFDGDKMQVWKLSALATGPQCLSADDCANRVIKIRYWYVHRIEMVNKETGEVMTPMRVVLIDSDGNAFGFVSNGVFQSLSQLVNIVGRGPYDPPLELRIVSTKLASKRSMLSIVPA